MDRESRTTSQRRLLVPRSWRRSSRNASCELPRSGGNRTAQGCRAAATLGLRTGERHHTPKGFRSSETPLGFASSGGRHPRVAAARQPWAMLSKPLRGRRQPRRRVARTLRGRRPRRGLTLLELVIVLTILVALAGLVVPMVSNLLPFSSSSAGATNASEIERVVQVCLSKPQFNTLGQSILPWISWTTSPIPAPAGSRPTCPTIPPQRRRILSLTHCPRVPP